MPIDAATNETSDRWWRDAVIYQIYPRSWVDSNGDGIGDLRGITDRLEHLSELGVDAVWISPFYASPQHDAGYDIADHRAVDPVFGTIADADALIARAHDLGLRIIVDLVPNHSSSDHPWFRTALAATPGSPERRRYLFRDGTGMTGELPPNNWQSNFGGPAWTRVIESDGRPGQWYLHLFDASQPDFDWTNPEVHSHLESVIRFWLDRGVDGFRIDVAHGLVKADGLPDAPSGIDSGSIDSDSDRTRDQPMWDQPGVHAIYRHWRTIIEEYATKPDGDRILCAEAWVNPPAALAEYVRPDELHQSFNFPFLMTPWLAADLRASIKSSLAAVEPYDAPQTWVLSNHDVVRHATRLGYPQVADQPQGHGIGADDPQPDAQLGLRRARAASTLMLALPGSAYLFQGEELGLPEATRLPDDSRQDPTWARSGHTIRGRDGCRVPIPWSGDQASYGFGPRERSWLPQPAEWSQFSVQRQCGVTGSTLELYRQLLTIRRERRLGRGTLAWLGGYADDVIAFSLTAADGTVIVLANLGDESLPLPRDAAVLVSSQPRESVASLGTDEAVWLLI